MVVSIPAKLYSATDDKRVSFHQYHTCGSRVTMPKFCAKCQKQVETAEIVKGYPVGDGYVPITESDLQSLPLKSIKSIEVVKFLDGSQIDQRAYGDCYYLSCEDTGIKPFTLFLTAMERANLIGIAKLAYRDREHLTAIRPFSGIMLLHTLKYADELRDFQEIKPKAVAIAENELELAKMLISKMTGDFNYTEYHDQYREALESMIEAKIAGKVIPAPVEQAAPVSDVVSALLQSINMAGAGASK